MTYTTRSEEETIALGERLATALPRVVLLSGDLGAGKTTLAKGILHAAAGVPYDDVASPTFTLIHEYPDRVYHIDLYRLETPEEAATLGLDEILDTARLVLIEWGERFPALFPPGHGAISITAAPDETRTIEVAVSA
jgi:tRNA threonylcarbamoyladenosine biosynthesis protein TsaE